MFRGKGSRLLRCALLLLANITYASEDLGLHIQGGSLSILFKCLKLKMEEIKPCETSVFTFRRCVNIPEGLKLPKHCSNDVRYLENYRIICSLSRETVVIISPLKYELCGPGSSVGIATDYGLDCPRSNPGGDEIFHLSRSALGPTQPPIKWVTSLSREESAAGACCRPLTPF